MKKTITQMYEKVRALYSQHKRLAFYLAIFVFIIVFLGHAEIKRLQYLKKYNEGVNEFDDGNYDEAKDIMSGLGHFEDAELYVKKADYGKAVQYYKNEEYEKAYKLFDSLGDYKDSTEMAKKANTNAISAAQYKEYRQAIKQFESKKFFEALDGFKKLGEYGDVITWMEKCKNNIRKNLATTIYAGTQASYAVTRYGNIVTTYTNSGIEFPEIKKISGWKGLISISAMGSCAIGIDIDGNVYLSEGDIDDAMADVSDWKDIVQVSSGDRFVVGLTSDQKVVASGRNAEGQLNVTEWNNIVQLDCGRQDTVALDKDGKLYIAGKHAKLASQINNTISWKNVVSISVGSAYSDKKDEGGFHIVGLHKDGTVVAFGDNNYGQCGGVINWSNIVKISAGDWTTVGLDKDGKVYVVGHRDDSVDEVDNSGNVTEWNNIADISAGKGNTLGVTNYGKALGTGYNLSPKTKKYSSWSNILVINPKS